MNSKQSLYNPFFSHIYIEKEAAGHPVSNKILACFPHAVPIEINHYKDIFCRNHQNYRMQKQTPSLILAKKHQNLVYEGAPVCQNFGNQHFYYTSSVMNCIYDCEYCYLQGMYPSANMVIFVNLEEVFEEVEQLLKKHPVYLCISYDTDLLALEHLLGYTGEWLHFAANHPDLSIEVRTKCANIGELSSLHPTGNAVLAWTLSPESTVGAYEHRTPSLEQRLFCINEAIDRGFPVRLCFDPMLYLSDWKEQYQELIERVFSSVSPSRVRDVSVGVFRISQDYLKNMRKQSPSSVLIQYPFENDNGVYHYSKGLTSEMISFACDLIEKAIPKKKIFVWEN